MLIIDGYAGKSRKLEEILIEKGASKENTLILDSVGLNALNRYGKHYLIPIQEIGNESEILQFIQKSIVENRHIEYIVLEFNVSRNTILFYKKMEMKFKREFILTVQCPADESQEEIKIYNL